MQFRLHQLLLPYQFNVIFSAPAAKPNVSADAHPTDDDNVPNAIRVPPEDRSYKFHPTTVASAVAVNDIVDLFVADICGEFSAAAFHDALPKAALLNGPSKAETDVGDAVANAIHLLVGCVAAAPPRTQSSKFLAWYAVTPMPHLSALRITPE